MATAPHCGEPRLQRTVWSGVLTGVGIAAFIDETVFHQLLHRHHFYDKATSSVGLVSDGIFHAFGWFAVAIGLALVADLRRREALTRPGLLGYDWTWNIIAVIFGPSAPSWCAPALSGCGLPTRRRCQGRADGADAHARRAHPGTASVVAAAAALLTVGLYLLAAERLLRRGDVWPAIRGVYFAAGGAGLAAAALAPMPGSTFTGHMAQHLITGMAAPTGHRGLAVCPMCWWGGGEQSGIAPLNASDPQRAAGPRAPFCCGLPWSALWSGFGTVVVGRVVGPTGDGRCARLGWDAAACPRVSAGGF
ncbi:DUF2243 domain-containing protein [Streptomyces fructofermentans]|uniref:DUF2243 domain-containing protein n=1 Tax=Streptomyces fructofermentans TaxID=152141 RepID=UPI00340FCF4F